MRVRDACILLVLISIAGTIPAMFDGISRVVALLALVVAVVIFEVIDFTLARRRVEKIRHKLRDIERRDLYIASQIHQLQKEERSHVVTN